jgi:hypothetical protein
MNTPLIYWYGKINGIHPLPFIWSHPNGLTKEGKYKTMNTKKQ